MRRRKLFVEQLEARVVLDGSGWSDLPAAERPVLAASIEAEGEGDVALEAQTIVVQPGPLVQGELLQDPPALSAEMQARLEDAPRGILPQPVDAGAASVNSPALETPAAQAPDELPSAPGNFQLYVNEPINVIPAGSSLNVNGPSLGTSGSGVFQAGNNYGSLSTDDGNNWSYVDPSMFPITGDFSGGFCCHHRVAQDESRDMVIWYLQYNKTGDGASDTNGVRIAVAQNEANLLSNTWMTYDFTPVMFGLGTGRWLDFPQMQATDDYLYFTTNVFSTTTNDFVENLLVRLKLQDLKDGVAASMNSWRPRNSLPDHETIGLVNGATDTMYAAAIVDGTTIRTFNVADSSTMLFSRTVGSLATTNFGIHTSIAPDGNNWTGRADSRPQTGWVRGSEVGFMWNSAQGTGRPQPFVRAVTLSSSDVSTVLGQPDIWSSSVAWHYPAIGVNAEGDIAGTVFVGGPSDYPRPQVIIDDEHNGAPTPWENHFTVAGSAAGNNRWGDYLGAQPDDVHDGTWIANGFVQNSASATDVTPYFFWFGREEDNPAPPPSSTELVGVDFGPPGDASPTNWNLIDGTVLTLNDLIDESGAATLIDLNITSDGIVSTDTGNAPTVEIPQHTNPLAAIDGNIWVSPEGTQITLTFSDLNPLGVYELYLFGLDTAALDNTVMITGNATTMFPQVTVSNSLMVNDELGDSGRNLSTFAEFITASGAGTIAIEVHKGSKFAGIGGVAIRLSPGGGPVHQFVVNSALDTSDANPGNGSCDDGGGNCTLRAAIEEANALPNLPSGPDLITFNIPGAGPHLIRPLNSLPTVTEAVDIDARTEPGYGETPLVEVRGDAAGAGVNGLTIVSGGSSVFGLAINQFGGSGIVLSNGSGNTIQQNLIGTDTAGTLDRGNGAHGVTIVDSANNTIGGETSAQRNVISGNSGHGVFITRAGSTSNSVQGNFIGLALNGIAPLGNDASGVRIDQGASNNTIGGAAGNVISANGADGVRIVGGTSTGNDVAGNAIGTNQAGNMDRGNGAAGVVIQGAPGNKIGLPGNGNLISGNTLDGVFISGLTATNNQVQGNLIGLNQLGTFLLPNDQSGVNIFGAPGNQVGGTVVGAGNTISGNAMNGVLISGANASANRIEGNLIGTNAAGTATVGNSQYGVVLRSAPNNTVGGTLSAARNVISGNALNGVGILETGATGNVVSGNYIGTNAAGDIDLGNGQSGVLIWKATSNRLGGLTAAERNVISGNDLYGVRLSASTTTGNVLQGNFIGTNAAGTLALPNGESGIQISNAQDNTIGGTTAAARNVISGNSKYGVILVGAGAAGNLVQGNFIGTNSTGTGAVGNALAGVQLRQGAHNNTIGGTTPGARNVISGNVTDGVALSDAGTRNNTVSGNKIGTKAAGTAALGNQRSGVVISDADTNTIGGTTTGARNVISGNQQSGVLISGSSATGNLIQGNFIGTDISGTNDLGNASTGVLITAPSNTVGGTAPGAGNLISGNDFVGVRLNTAGATGNLVQGNFVGTQAGGVLPLGNTNTGIRIDGGSNNTIGGTTAGARNVVAHNSNRGIAISGGGTGNRVQRNSTFFNTGLGIDLNLDGVTANDPNDPDSGTNRLQNFPVISAIAENGGNLDITYSVPTAIGNARYPLTVEFFLADSANQEGRTFLGSDTYSAGSAGLSKLATIAAGGAGGGDRIVATATDADGNTSEFSLGVLPSAPSADALAAASGESALAAASVSASPWQNPVNQLDVDGDQVVSPLDALMLINMINLYGAVNLEAASGGAAGWPFFDVSGDRFVSSLDVVQLVNALNQTAVQAAEGEASALQPPIQVGLAQSGSTSSLVASSLVASFQPAASLFQDTGREVRPRSAVSAGEGFHQRFVGAPRQEVAELTGVDQRALSLLVVQSSDLLSQLAIDISAPLSDRQSARLRDDIDSIFADYL